VTFVKVCGLSELEDVTAAALAGADFVGFVFAESRRRVTADKARDLVAAIGTRETRPATVGVFAGSPAAEVNRIAAYCGLDRVQLSGGESWRFCSQIDRPIIKTIHVAPQSTGDSIRRMIQEGRRLLKDKDHIFLLDTNGGAASGGTGLTFDWELAREVAAVFPVVIAGGLTPGNVADLISRARPWGVDVSSGVETDGKKDAAKISAFIRVVRGTGSPAR
jgi:phosphoribosylanthranilate isomerase